MVIPLNQYTDVDPIYLVVDLFCGAGGVSTGFVRAVQGFAQVIACVNHDPKAIASHLKNYPGIKHYEEDIRTLDITELIELVNQKRRDYPLAKVILWASLECTNFSKAKGGQPRNGDSRTLADHLHRYITGISPDYIQIENVEEFRSWGPLDEFNKPESRHAGEDFVRWCKEVDAHGYYNEWATMNSADFGAYTSRKRLFGCFARHWLPIVWPETTHSKKATPGKLKWLAVKKVLDLKDEGVSIFGRKKPYTEKTLLRLYSGLIKHVAGGKDAFLVKWNSMSQKGVYHAPDLENPCPVISTQNRLGVAQVNFLSKQFGGSPEGKSITVDGPAGTVTCIDHHALVGISFFSTYYGNGYTTSIDSPCPTITTKDRFALIQAIQFIDKKYTGKYNHQSVEQPAGVITTNDHHALVSVQPFLIGSNFTNVPTSLEDPAPTITANRKWSYLVNPGWFGNPHSVEEPCPTIIARQDKAPLYVVNAPSEPFQQVFIQIVPELHPVRVFTEQHPESTIVVYQISEFDCPTTIDIVKFMAMYGITDIKMRMLKVSELKVIQGFPAEYILEGSQADQKKFIGNSVVPQVVTHWIEAMAINYLKKQAA